MAKKRYYNESEDKWYTEGQSMTRRIDKSTIWSGVPTLEQLTEWGYEEYIEPTPPPYEPTYEEKVVALIRERYTLDDELALERQRYTKVEEFAAYDEYCEECKRRAKGENEAEEGGA